MPAMHADGLRLDGKRGTTIRCGHGPCAHHLVEIGALASSSVKHQATLGRYLVGGQGQVSPPALSGGVVS
jgi:hypothetical protein